MGVDGEGTYIYILGYQGTGILCNFIVSLRSLKTT